MNFKEKAEEIVSRLETNHKLCLEYEGSKDICTAIQDIEKALLSTWNEAQEKERKRSEAYRILAIRFGEYDHYGLPIASEHAIDAEAQKLMEEMGK